MCQRGPGRLRPAWNGCRWAERHALILRAAPTSLEGAKLLTSVRAEPSPVAFTARERELIRQEMGQHFGQFPSLVDGIFLRTWRGGPQKNQPKIPPAIRSMADRVLVEIRTGERGPRAFFTEAGLQELRRLVLDRRYMDPERFGHLRSQLGLDSEG